MDLKKLVQTYLTDNKHMQLATVREGKPWVCTVYYVSDDSFNLYWTSDRSRQHSKEILDNSTAAVTVVKDIENKQALQITGDAYEVTGDELDYVHGIYQQKFGAKDYDIEEMQRHDPNGRSYWIFKPNTISLWDEVNFPHSPKQLFTLK